MMRFVRMVWSAASTPATFFAKRADDEPRPLRAFAVAALAWSVGAVLAGWALALATQSAPGVLILATVGLSLPYLFLVWGLGGLSIVRTGRLDLRAWDVAGWSWVPAALLGLALAPVAPIAPIVALAVGLLLLPAWNLFIVVGGLRAYAPPESVRAASLIYLAVVYIAPLAFTGFAFWIVNAGLAG